MKKIYVAGIVGIFLFLLIPFVVGQSSGYYKKTEDINTSYPRVSIMYDNSTVFSMELIKNTEQCAAACESIIKINSNVSYQLDDKNLANISMGFEDLNKAQSKNIAYSFDMATKNKTISNGLFITTHCNETLNPNYPTNTTNATVCWNEYQDLSYYDFKSWDYKIPTGESYLRLSGNKSMYDSIDWFFDSLSGVEIKDWAIWGNVTPEFSWTWDDSNWTNYGNNSAFAVPSKTGTESFGSGGCIDGICINSSAKYQDSAYGAGQEWYGTVCNWVKYNPVPNALALLIADASGANVGDVEWGINLLGDTSQKWMFNMQGGAGTDTIYSPTPVLNNTWTFICGKANATGHYLYWNGTKVNESLGSGGKWFGADSNGGIWYNLDGSASCGAAQCIYDSLRLYSPELADGDINAIYVAEGSSPPANNVPNNITSFTPANNTAFSWDTTSVELNATVSDPDGDNMTVYFYSDSALLGNDTATNGTIASYTLSGLTNTTTYYWKAMTCDATDCSANTSLNQFYTETCVESWSCSTYDSCDVSGKMDCLALTDASGCGTSEPALSGYSAICTYTGGGGGGGYTPEPEELAEGITEGAKSFWNTAISSFSTAEARDSAVTVIQILVVCVVLGSAAYLLYKKRRR